jgi:hypothetical protein
MAWRPQVQLKHRRVEVGELNPLPSAFMDAHNLWQLSGLCAVDQPELIGVRVAPATSAWFPCRP